MTLYWYNPFDVTNAETRFAHSVSGICQYPFSKSNLLTNLAGPILSMQSSIRGMGYESVLVTAFNFF